jgi:hypothetical protein
MHFRSQGPSWVLVHIPVIDTYPETDYLSAKRLALSGTGGRHLVMLRTPRTLQGGCDDGR